MTKTGIWAIIVATAFIAGTLMANPVADAAGGWKEAIDNLGQTLGLTDSCADGEVLKWNSATSSWECASDNDTTAIPAGSITTTEIADGTITSTDIADGTIVASDLGDSLCADGQVLKWNDAVGIWGCATDIDTDTNAGTLCSAGQYLDGDGTCKPVPVDTDTDTNTNAATICPNGTFLNGDGTCDPVYTDADARSAVLIPFIYTYDASNGLLQQNIIYKFRSFGQVDTFGTTSGPSFGISGEIVSMHARSFNGASQPISYNVLKNNAGTTLACLSTSPGICSDTGNVSISPTDRITIKVDVGITPTCQTNPPNGCAGSNPTVILYVRPS